MPNSNCSPTNPKHNQRKNITLSFCADNYHVVTCTDSKMHISDPTSFICALVPKYTKIQRPLVQ